MTLVDSVEAGKLTISELIDTLAKDKNYESSKWGKRWQPAKKLLYGLAQSDFYQMFAYSQKHLGGTGEMCLIYPAHDDFNQPIQQHFSFSETLKLWVVPYWIRAKRGERMMWVGDIPSV
ncbi:5-methylcytosine restriction system specificity protein McrC [Hafnia paralvei]|uniref:5-methylcytosine restriction system specificity protein McrC n=1 Tax=Hafnia paralvei TaxID=546367 RepID=UPI000FDBEBF4|nr:hypothetical protein [Hafnia paralvei]